MGDTRNEYADAAEAFRRLKSLPKGSPEHQRQRDEIIAYCLPLADHVARRFRNRGQELEDLVQVARVGLVNAVNRFDVDAGSEFVAFAVPTIVGEVRRHFRDHTWSVKVPRRMKDLRTQVNRGREDLYQRLQRQPNASELAAHLGMDGELVIDALVAASAYKTASTDTPMGDGDNRERWAEARGGCDANFDRVLAAETVRPLIATLPPRERTVLLLRFFENLTQTEIADRIGVSQMQVSRILARALLLMRQRAEVPDARSPRAAMRRIA
jgi:RNA polymerase sigma-B factor